MIKLYKKYLYIPKNERIQDKVFSIKIAVSVCIIMMLLSAAGITAYAYFSSDASVSVASITAARYELDYSITKDNTEISAQADGYYYLSAGTYKITISAKGSQSNASTGFCIVQINDEKYHTSQIGRDVNASADKKRETLAFTLVVNENSEAKVSFAAHWGTSSNYGYNTNTYYISNDKIVTVGNVSNGSSDSDKKYSEENNSDESYSDNNNSDEDKAPDDSEIITENTDNAYNQDNEESDQN